MAAKERITLPLRKRAVIGGDRHHQHLPFLGGAIREAFDVARGSHVIVMASDLETDPNDVGKLIAAAEKNASGVVATSRWL